MAEAPDDPERPAASGVRTTRHRGRMTDAKRALLVDLAPRWAVDPTGPWTRAHLAERFGRTAPLFVDIGVGDGVATRAWAEAEPGADVLAVELHRPGVARLFSDLEASGPGNVRVAMADACEVLDRFEPAAIAHLRVLFPDPWPKRRHVKNRLVDRAFVTAAARAIRPGGVVHLATDWAEYADHMRTMVATEPIFVPRADGPLEPGGTWISARPPRPTTAYEQRGLRAGRTATDLVWTRSGEPT